MTLARLALLVAAYVLLDLSNPMMPGALAFGVEDSVEVRQSDRFRCHDSAEPMPLAPALKGIDRPRRSVALRRPPAPGTPRFRHAPVTRHPSLLAPSAPSEDH
jgi:hypothetical protein